MCCSLSSASTLRDGDVDAEGTDVRTVPSEGMVVPVSVSDGRMSVLDGRMSVTLKLQNASMPSRRMSMRGAPIHDSDCVGMMLGHAVLSKAPDTRCGRSAS